eukprot:GDKI01039430.1.p1 GENE.GDKI01039430.1~~GDKI01039430.1.p1  ORF type:complete len:386 (+),score=119.10 GDKI01039430.1:100-1257(+)
MQYSLFQWGVFAIMTVQRATHNSLLEYAKEGKKDFPFPAATVAWTSQVLCIIIPTILAYFVHDGMKAVKACVSPKGAIYYGWAALWFSIGDVFEIEVNRFVDSATYTVLSQSKLLITAFLMLFLMRKNQTPLQWMLLFVLTLGMGEYVLCNGSTCEISPTGITLAVVKVLVSCVGAVLLEKGLKNDQGTPFLATVAQIKIAQAFMTFFYFVVKDWDFLTANNFNILTGWTPRTYILVFVGFVLKSILSQLLLKEMDSLLKNISEVAAMVLVYFNKILFMGGVFSMTSFIAALIVSFSVLCYMLDVGEQQKRQKIIEKERALLADTQPIVHTHTTIATHTIGGDVASVYVRLEEGGEPESEGVVSNEKAGKQSVRRHDSTHGHSLS